ncbi:hypothetical protein DFR57_10719 [Saliterribacillus persicus]|uniref:Antigen I/II N-terminal domain-containing protein n=2 Tax=Saliterribacillus persicus TaxID=930114 RepID=A0A368XNR2_9BACI|nr:hypothetical protein DFR57_10719 [Saliterribacillus persicus]
MKKEALPMKKLVVVGLSVLTLVGCGMGDSNSSSETIEKIEAKVASENLDSGETTLTIPAEIAAVIGQDMKEPQAQAKAEGLKEVVENKDGSLTYTMSKTQVDELKKGITSQMDRALQALKDKEVYPSVQDISMNDSFSELIVKVDATKFEGSLAEFTIKSIGMQGLLPQVIEEKEAKMTLTIEDAKTGEVIESIQYPEDAE